MRKPSMRFVWLALLLLGAGAGIWLMTQDRAQETVALRDLMIDLEEADQTELVDMPRIEREQLVERGVLTNADRPLYALMRDPAVIMLRNAIIDTALQARGGPTVEIPEAFRAPSDYRQAIIVFHEPVSMAQWDWVAEQGLRVENFVPNRALAVSGEHDDIVRLADDAMVRHIEPFHPFFKMNSDIQAHLLDTADSHVRERATSGRYHVLLFGEPEDALASAVSSDDARRLPGIDSPGVAPRTGGFGIAGAQIKALPSVARQAVVEVVSDPGSLAQLVLAENVKWVEPAPRFESMNDLGRRSTRRNLVQEMHPGLDGTGQIIGVVDTGADVDHPALTGRMVPDGYQVGPSTTSDGLVGDARGHGTHVLGTILGNGALSGTVISAPGSASPPYAANQFAGMAPNARYVMVEDFNSFSHQAMALKAYERGARIANNSWGAAQNFDYGIASMYWDALVKDVDWGNPAAQPYTVFFAAGNSGGGLTDGSGGIAGTISQPGNAKNVITIGAIEQKRDADNLTQSPYASLSSTDTDWQVASFSGRGPTQDGRVKPDLVAPGEYVLSLQSSEIDSEIIDSSAGEIRDFRAGNVATGPNYAFMSGTSRSTAFASGAAALLRQHFAAEYGRNPSPAMMKALLISGARNLHSSAYEWGPKRNDSALAIDTIVHPGTIDPRPEVFGWWSFEGNYLNAPNLLAVNGTNVFVNPGSNPGLYVVNPVNFTSLDANPGFGGYLRMGGGSVRFEMTDEAITNGWHADPHFKVNTVEFWLRRSGTAENTQSIIEFTTDDMTNPRVILDAANIVGTEGIANRTIYINGSAQLPLLASGWNHVVIVSPVSFAASDFTLGNLNADIDELRLHNAPLSAAGVQQNYEDGLGYEITANPDLEQQLGGMFREELIHDGWGQLDIAGAIRGAATFTGNEVRLFDELDVAPLTTGADWQYLYHVPEQDAKGSLKITLTWTDTHGNPGAARDLVNDLDLRVTYAPGTADEVVYIGNFMGRKTWGTASYPIVIDADTEFDVMSVVAGQFASITPLVLRDERQLEFLHDRQNNVEQVIIRDLLPGNYMVTVQGAQVPVEGETGGQNFALVINRGVSSAGEAMGEEPDLTVDNQNTPVLAYTTREAANDPFTQSPGRTQIAVRRWLDRETAKWPAWHRLENKWFHYGDGPHREIISRSEIGSATAPTLAFDDDNTLYVAWIQGNDDVGVPDAVYLRYLAVNWQNQSWDGINRWQQLGESYQSRGLSGDTFPENVVSPTVRVGLNNQPIVSYRQGNRVMVKTWHPGNMAWQGLDGSVTGVVTSNAAPAPVEMAIDASGHPVLLWTDAGGQGLRVQRWNGDQWRAVAGGLVGDSTATDAAIACDAFGSIAISWVALENQAASVRAAWSTIGGTSWSGFIHTDGNSRNHPGLSGTAVAGSLRSTRAEFTPRGNLMVAWLAENEKGEARQILRQYDGVQWNGIYGSERSTGLYDSIGALDQPVLISDADGYPLVAVRSMRTAAFHAENPGYAEEVSVLRSHRPDHEDPPLADYDDLDGDGLHNLAEIKAGTDPFIFDTAGDGFSDFYGFNAEADGGDRFRIFGELYTAYDGMAADWKVAKGLDPERFEAHEDTDGDGWSNLSEFMAGVDPQALEVMGAYSPTDPDVFPRPNVAFNIDYKGENATGPLVIHAYSTINMDGPSDAVFFHEQAGGVYPAGIVLRDAASGYLREGATWFFAFIDRNQNGTWDPGEPAGMPHQQPIRVGWQQVGPISIGLTDTAHGFPRFAWAPVAGVNAYEVSIRNMSLQGGPIVVQRTIRAPRHYVHAQDYLLAGHNYGMRNAGYQWFVHDSDRPTEPALASGSFNVTNFVAMAAPVPVLPANNTTLRHARNDFVWTMDPIATVFQLQIAKDSSFSQTVFDRIVLAPVRAADGSSAYSVLTPTIDGTYYWRVRAGHPNSFSPFSAAQALHVDLGSRTGGPYTIGGKLLYPGKVTNAAFIIEAYISPCFSGYPVAQVSIPNTASMDTLPRHLMPYQLRGLREGTYYVRGFLDQNQNQRQDVWETQGFVRMDAYHYYPKAISVPPSRGSELLSTMFRDTDNDRIPDEWEFMHYGNLTTADDGATTQIATSDGSLLTYYEVYAYIPMGADPDDPDVAGLDGIPLRVKAALGLDYMDEINFVIASVEHDADGNPVIRWNDIQGVDAMFVDDDDGRSVLGGEGGLIYVVQFSSNLRDWFDIDGTVTIEPDGSGVQFSPDAQSLPGRGFYRLAIRW